LELETTLKEERSLNKRNAKENNAREKELWSALENVQSEHERAAEQLKRETKDKVRCILNPSSKLSPLYCRRSGSKQKYKS